MTDAPIAGDFAYDDQPSVLIVGDDVAALHDAEVAADHADRRLIASVGLSSAAAALARSVAPGVIMVEAARADAAAIGSALTTVDAIARERGIDVVVVLDDDQIDLVAAHLFGRHAQLLCGATITARVAALTWAGASRHYTVHDSARDADERLRQLNAEVARFAETLSQLAADRVQPRTGQVRDAAMGFHHQVPTGPVTPTEPAVVRDVIRSRRLRATHFPPELFADPAWDMLLDLFAAELEHRRVSVSSLCIAAAVPGTTALRWIGSMVETGLFERYADPQDRRRAFISLSSSAREGMQRYFDAVRRAGLAPA